MSFVNKAISFFVILITLISCSEDEGDVLVENKEVLNLIESFKIIVNEETKLVSETKLTGGLDLIEEAGMIWERDNIKCSKIGDIGSEFFLTEVKEGIAHNIHYDFYPYIKLKNGNLIYGDTLYSKSNVKSDFKIESISPLKGFIGDTITIKGNGFCKDVSGSFSILFFNETHNRTFFKSDSLLLAVVGNDYVKRSNPEVILEACNIKTSLNEEFTYNIPLIDSIETGDFYMGDNFKIYGKNIDENLSKLWINGSEINLKYDDTINIITAIVPDNLPADDLDIKLQVIDRVIDKKGFFKSTSPKMELTYPDIKTIRDTFEIRGKYLTQKNTDNLKVFIDNKEQTIVSKNDTLIKVLTDKIFYADEPVLKINVDNFELETTDPLSFNPPKIIEIDKEIYHLDSDIILKTEGHIFNRNNIEVGEVGLKFDTDTNWDLLEGNVSFNIKDWMKVGGVFDDYMIDENSNIRVRIFNQFGEDSRVLEVYAPELTSIENDNYNHNERIDLEGLDLGHDDISDIYVDGILVPDPHLSSYSLRNYGCYFEVPASLSTGEHYVTVKRGNKESNKIPFIIDEVLANSITPLSGNRNTEFTIYGSNLEKSYTYGILANGIGCEIIKSDPNSVTFNLPQFELNYGNVEISISYGDDVIEVGFVNVNEPYSILANDMNIPGLSFLYNSSGEFVYNQDQYFISRKGIYRLDLNLRKWILYESNLPDDFTLPDVSRKPEFLTYQDDLYIDLGNKIQIYNFLSKEWKIVDTGISEDWRIKRLGVFENKLYAFSQSTGDFGKNKKIFELDIHSFELLNEISTPANSNFNAAHFKEGKFFYNGYANFYFDVYDFNTNQWSKIDFQGSVPFSNLANVYFHDNILFVSGGYLSGVLFSNIMYSYNFESSSWTERTPMPGNLSRHTLFPANGGIYICLGAAVFGNVDNYDLIFYDYTNDM